MLEDETVAVLGYGVQGPGQALNMSDNGFNGHRRPARRRESWDKAVADGLVPGKTLFHIEEAAEKATVIQYLVSDAGQMAIWPTIKECLNEGRRPLLLPRLSIVYKDQTGSSRRRTST